MNWKNKEANQQCAFVRHFSSKILEVYIVLAVNDPLSVHSLQYLSQGFGLKCTFHKNICGSRTEGEAIRRRQNWQ